MQRFLQVFILIAAMMAAALPGATAQESSPLRGLSGADNARISVYVEDLRDNRIIHDYNATEPLIPASITKAVTTAAVLDLHSPSARFATVVDLCGRVDAAGVLDGNVRVVCSGDPTLESAYFDSIADVSFVRGIARAIADSGITAVRGRVIVDSSMRADEDVPSGWERDDLSLPYGTNCHAANFRDNLFVVSLPSGSASPLVPDLKIRRKAPKSKGLRISKSAGSNEIDIIGRTPRRGLSRTFPNSSPALSLEAELERALRDEGVRVEGKKIDSAGKPSLTIAIHRSPTYAEISRSLMTRSDNMMAEAMLRTLAPDGRRAGALVQERDILTRLGANLDGVYIEDGSGLSRNNRVTARFMGDLLAGMAVGERAPEYMSVFPRAGVEGTVRNLLKDTPLAGRLALKSGSMKGVRCYAGYALGLDGRPTHAVVIMVNGYFGPGAALRKSIEDFLLNEFS